MSWKGVQGGNPEGEERMRGSALSSPMGVPLVLFYGYKKNEEDEKREMFELRSHVSPHTHGQFIALGCERMRGSALSSPMGVPLGYFHE